MPDPRVMIGGAVAVVVLLLLWLLVRSRSKSAEPPQPTHVPPNPFDKPASPPSSGPVSAPGPASAPISGRMPSGASADAGPLSGPISTPGGAPPMSGPISAPGAAAPVSGPTSAPMTPAPDAQAMPAPIEEPEVERTQALADAPPRPVAAPAPAFPSPVPPPPVAPIEEPDTATIALDHPPVSLEPDAVQSVHEPEPAPAAAPTPPPPPPPTPVPAKPAVAAPAAPPPPARPAAPAPKPIAAKPAPPAAPAPSKQTSPATPQAIGEAVKRTPSKPDVPQDAELDFSALRDKAKSDRKVPAAADAAPAPEPAAPAPAPAPAPTGLAAKYMAPSNPETAELEKSDPRHAAARRLARLSVSEIKLYHEADVTEGRAKKDLWTRLQADIALATQTYDKRVDQEVRDRFDYLYDEILRQLAQGDAELLGPAAPKKKAGGAAPESQSAKATAPAVTKRTSEPMPAAPKVEAKAEPPKSEPKAAAAAPAPTPAAPAEAKPTMPGARFAPPSNPETAELEKSDPRHAAARRLARLSVSEIKLYHEDEVKAGREKKDLYTRLGADISLAKQTFDKRVDQEVRDRFDYLYDEIVRQLAEGNEELLGPDAPPKKKPAAAAAPAPAPEPASPEPPKAEPPPKSEPKPEPPKAEPPKSEPKPAAAAPAASATTQPSAVSKYLAPSNPATAELEKSDPRHAAARRLARLSVSEIKLYHEDEVKAGREKKDLWTRLQGDIALAKQTFDKRVDQEVRDRFDYLYDEIVRQLAEGDSEKLGPEAPKPKQA